MRITVSVGRGRPLPWPVALGLTAIGAAMAVVGLAMGSIDVPGGSTGAIPLGLAVVLVVPLWAVLAIRLVARERRRGAALDGAGVPDVLAEPPGRLDPAVVGAVIGRGRTPSRAVAATVLSLAERGWLDIHEVGERVVISFDPTPADARPVSATDELVYRALAARADPSTGDVVGPPVWGDVGDWWPAFAGDARARAMAGGFVEPRIPMAGAMVVSVLTATVFALALFWYTLTFVGLILLANGVPHLLVRASGFRLTEAGLVARAHWLAFGRGLRERGGLARSGPGAITVWGPYLVYGVLLGAGPDAARVLTPEVGRDVALPREMTVIYDV